MVLTRYGLARTVELKVHRARWSRSHPENSLAAIAECCRERVRRVEIDVPAALRRIRGATVS